ncbi:UNVERIFIED_CONTAM: hypothetical protein RMT77_015391 [Armadillidium vulgare]
MTRSDSQTLPSRENALHILEKNFYSFRIENLDFTSALQKYLAKTFHKLGILVARHPLHFIVISLIICCMGFFGILRIDYISKFEDLYLSTDSPSKAERTLIEHFFPLNSSNHFLPHFVTRNQGYGRIFTEAKDKGSIFRKHIWEEAIGLNETVTNFAINYKGRDYSYKDICAKWNNQCISNKVLDLYEYIESIENGSFKINYPTMLSPLILPMFFGGITVDKEGLFMESAKSLSLIYFLNVDKIEDRERAELWERKFLSIINGKSYNFLRVTCSTSKSFQEGAENILEVVLPFIPIVGISMVLFSVSNTMMSDWVRSKFYLGLIGLLSTALATGGSCGYLMLFGISIGAVNILSPFLIIGIGLDDMFVTLASWRRTNIQDSVEKRLAETYADVGLSILFTSLTNMISFLVGIIAPFPAIKMFCIYSATSIAALYLLHMTFFGGFLAIFGNYERDQLHSVTFKKVLPKSDIECAQNKCYSFWCAGGINKEDPQNEIDNKPHIAMVFFRDYFAKLLTKNYAKWGALILYVLYLSVSIYGIFHLREGFEKSKSIRYDSHLFDFLSMEDSLYRHHAYNIQIIITGDIKYSNSTTRKMIMDLHKDFENLPFIESSIFTISWMRSWFYKLKRNPSLGNTTDESEFIDILRKNYLTQDSNIKFFDVVYNDDFSRIVASRFFIQTAEIKDSVADLKMMIKLREIAHRSPLNVTVYNPNFVFFDQGIYAKSVAVDGTIIASVAMVIVSLLFIPNKLCSIYIGLTIISVNAGVFGFMSLWDVSLNMLSMYCVIMCIGFCVDFTAHVSYSFCSSELKSSDEKIMNCLYCLGLPIVQGGFSTIISIWAFCFFPSYAFIYFFKVVFLVILFSLLHSLIFLPVLLSVVGPETFMNCFRVCKNTFQLLNFKIA